MAAQFQDPRGEYSKQCPYCLEYITVNHLNRLFCTEKNGIRDFCKNRFKRLKYNLMGNGVILDKAESIPLKITFNSDHSKTKKTIDESIHDSIVRRNKKILESLLGSEESVKIELHELKKEGYDADFFDSELDNLAGVQLHSVGRFAVAYLDNNSVVITLLKLLDL